MNARNILFGAASALVLVGTLMGVGCKSSSNKSATPTSPMMHETPANTSTVSQTQTTATYTIVLKIGPAEQMMMSGTNATSGEIMVPMSGMPTPSMMTTDQGQTVNHHLEVHITKTATGASVTDVVPTISITDSAGTSRQISEVMQMYDAAMGTSDTHFGNNVYLADGQYSVTVKVGQETAQFTNLAVSNGGTPAAMGTAAMMTTGTPESMTTPAATQMQAMTPTP